MFPPFSALCFPTNIVSYKSPGSSRSGLLHRAQEHDKKVSMGQRPAAVPQDLTEKGGSGSGH